MHIEVESKRLKYILDVEGKYSVILGESGTGKTNLHELLLNSSRNRMTKVTSDVSIKVLDSPYWGSELKGIQNHVIVIDDKCAILAQSNTPEILEASDNCFIIMSRDETILPKSADITFYEMKTDGREHWLERVKTSKGISKMEVF